MPKRPKISGLAQRIQGAWSDKRHPVDAFTEDGDAGVIVNVRVDAIGPNPDQPRKHFDENSLRELSDSIRQYGVLEPIIVHREGEGFTLISGERRLRATKMAELVKIPAIVRNRKDDREEIALIENLQRENLDPLEEAESLQRLKDRRKLTDEKLARIVGKSRVSVTETLTLTRLPEAVKAECRPADKYPKSLLVSIVRAPSTDAQLALWSQVKDGRTTRAQLRQATKDNHDPRPKPYEFKFQPEKKAFTVRVTFRKSRASQDDIRQALREALKNLT